MDMLHVIGIILKIIGILLAVLLGTLVMVILLALFVPVRYRFFIKKRDDMLIDGKVHWLLHLIHGHFVLEDKKPVIILRIFGIKVFDSTRVKKEKKEKPEKAKVKKAKKDRNKDKEAKGKERKVRDLEKKAADKKDKLAEHTGNPIEKSKETPETVQKEKQIEKTKITSEGKEESVVQTKSEVKADGKQELTVKETLKQGQSLKEETISKKDVLSEKQSSSSQDESAEDSTEKTKKVSFFGKIRDGIKKAIDTLRNLKEKLQKILKIIRDVFEKKNLVMAFLKDEGNKSGMKTIFASLWGILKHVSPHTVEGYFKYGTGDPYTTGEALAALSFVYAMYGDKFSIEPDFMNKVFEAEVKVRGRVRLFNLLKIGIKLWRDEHFKYIKKSIGKLKEEVIDGR